MTSFFSQCVRSCWNSAPSDTLLITPHTTTVCFINQPKFPAESVNHVRQTSKQIFLFVPINVCMDKLYLENLVIGPTFNIMYIQTLCAKIYANLFRWRRRNSYIQCIRNLQECGGVSLIKKSPTRYKKTKRGFLLLFAISSYYQPQDRARSVCSWLVDRQTYFIAEAAAAAESQKWNDPRPHSLCSLITTLYCVALSC